MDQDKLWAACIRLDTDYMDYGGKVARWSDPSQAYPDCSSGCKWFTPLHDFETDSWDTDWGVCSNPNSPRKGLLTWEHQSGYTCYEYDEELNVED